jgi:hypothetical protein
MAEAYKTSQSTNLERLLLEMADKGAPGKANKLLTQGKVPPDCRDDKGRTPLIRASDAGNAAMVGVLISHNANVNAQDDDGETGLIKTVRNDDIETAKLLLSNGADQNIPNNDGLTASDMAPAGSEMSAVLFAHAVTPISVEEKETSSELNEEGLTTNGSASQDEMEPGKSEDNVSTEVALAVTEEFNNGENVEGRADIAAAGLAVSAESAVTTRAMTLDEIVQLVERTDHESDDMQKKTSREISVQFTIQPSLFDEMKARKGFRHAGTIRRWKAGGDMDIRLTEAGFDTATLTSSVLQELYKCPEEHVGSVTTEAISKGLSVRDVRKMILPYIATAKLKESGDLTDVCPECVEIIKALESPEKIVQRQEMVNLFRDPNRLKSEFTFIELSRIHEKANAAETKVEKQKRTLEEKSAGFMPIINFLRLIRKNISAVFNGDKG